MKRRFYSRLVSHKALLPVICGGMALQFFTSCDPEVRATVLGGLQESLIGLATSMLNAFFMSLAGSAGGGNSTTQPVVQAVFEFLQTGLA
jgi:hypothetical protein